MVVAVVAVVVVGNIYRLKKSTGFTRAFFLLKIVFTHVFTGVNLPTPAGSSADHNQQTVRHLWPAGAMRNTQRD